jgi:hypothetical protein
MNSKLATGTRKAQPDLPESNIDDRPTGAEQLYRNYLKARRD